MKETQPCRGANCAEHLEIKDTFEFQGRAMMKGGAGNDTLLGTPMADTLDGGPGNDSLNGMAGNDLLLA